MEPPTEQSNYLRTICAVIVPIASDLDWARFHRAFGDDLVLPDGEVMGSTEHD
jgi:hypothetical protein